MAPGVGIPEPSGDPPGEDNCGGDEGSKARIVVFCCRPGTASAAGVEVSTSFNKDCRKLGPVFSVPDFDLRRVCELLPLPLLLPLLRL